MYRGKLVEAEDNMNSQMASVTVTYRDGRVAQLENIYIRGSKIRFMILPDMLKNAPMLKNMGGRGGGRGGAARGKSSILAGQARSGGRGGGPGRGRGGPGDRGGFGGRGEFLSKSFSIISSLCIQVDLVEEEEEDKSITWNFVFVSQFL